MGAPAGPRGATEASPLLSPPPPAPSPSRGGLSAAWSHLTFGWYTPVPANIQSSLDRGVHPDLEKDEGVPTLPEDARAEHVHRVFHEQWLRERQERPHDPRVWRALLKAFGAPFINAIFLSMLGIAAQYIPSFLMNLMVKYLLDPNSTAAYGVMLLVAMSSSQLANALFSRHASYLLLQVGIRVKTALVYEIFDKALRIDSSYFQDHSIGKVINMMNSDVSKVANLLEYGMLALMAPVNLAFAIGGLWILLGYSCLGGVVVLLISIPITTTISASMFGVMMKRMKATDDRVQCNHEVVSSMSIIKWQAWEESFSERTQTLREAEMKELFNFFLRQSSLSLWNASIPILVLVLSFGLYVVLGNALNASTAATVNLLFNQLRVPLMILPGILGFGIETLASFKRIESFLTAPDVERVPKLTNDPSNGSIIIKSSTYSYHGFQKHASENAQLGLKHQVGRTEQELLLVKAKLGDVQERLAKLESHQHQQEYGTSDKDRPTDSHDGYRDILSLRRVNFTCEEGEFVAVVGGVGSGKSTLLKAILGEIHKVSGESGIRGSVAYFEQDPFIMNDTVKGNVLFGRCNEVVDEDLYRLAIKSACLEHDLELLGGDQTLIGEKGTGLSGGQQARVAIGRAVYRDADITLLDDCLRAVDAKVGRELFDNCIVDVLLGDNLQKGSTRKRTVILVTNNLQYLRHQRVDRIVVMKDGLIVESGSHGELVGRKGSHFKSMLDTFNESMAKEEEAEVIEEDESSDEEEYDDYEFDAQELEGDPSDVSLSSRTRRSSILSAAVVRAISRSSLSSTVSRSSSRQRSSRRLSIKAPIEECADRITSEAAQGKTGKVEWGLYMAWIKAAGGVWIVFPLLLFTFGPQIIEAGQTYFLLNNWGIQGYPDRKSQFTYLSIYTFIGFAVIIVGFFRSIVPYVWSMKASKAFFSSLLDSILHAPMSFFENIPIGRLLNVFSKDVNVIDETLINTFTGVMYQLIAVAVALFLLVTAVPQLVVILPFMAMVYRQQYTYFSQSNRELKRIDSANASPVYSLFSETLHGYCTIRAMAAEPALLSRLIDSLDRQQHAAYLVKVGNCWLAVRLEFIGSLLNTAAIASFVWSHQMNPYDESFASMASLALTYLLPLSSSLKYAIQSMSDLEKNMVSIERVQQYIDIDQEAPHKLQADKALDKDWPANGQIELKNYDFRYRQGLPLILKGMNLTIPSRARVGIVGRTGSGKSTLMRGLTRMAEPAGGKIILDGVDITTVGLAKLRSNIAIVPQDPVLFSGTVRTNMDPFGQHHDDRLMDALDRVGLCTGDSSSAVKSLEDKVDKGGGNFSAGQRQLLVIARALLGGASVVICDEATSSMDAGADARIQEVFRSDFAHATTLTVAHRLNTIMDSTHILVMSDGKAVEFDSPRNLLAKGGLFKDFVDKWEEEH